MPTQHVTPLSWAALHGNAELIRLLLQYDAEINTMSKGFTPLANAIKSRHHAAAEVLIKQGATLTNVNNHEHSALHIAAWKGQLSIITLLIAQGVDINIQDTLFGFTPLYHAILEGQYDSVKILLDNEANVNLVSTTGNSPLDLALQSKNKKITKLLRSKNALNADALNR